MNEFEARGAGFEDRDTKHRTPRTVTVLSLNLWNYRGDWRARRARIAALIRAAKPDVVGLQEVRRDPRYAFGINQAAQLARLTGLRQLYAPAMRYWYLPRIEEGLAVLTPHHIVRHETIPLCWDRHDRRDPNRRIALHVTLALPAAPPLDCWVTHLNQYPPMRDASAQVLRDAHAATPSALPPLVMGDCNAVPSSATIRTLTEHRLADLWPLAHPDDPGPTYPAEAPTERIDYLFAGPDWRVERMERIGLGGRDLSDHCGLLATLVLSREQPAVSNQSEAGSTRRAAGGTHPTQ